jgi:hypothetical protein
VIGAGDGRQVLTAVPGSDALLHGTGMEGAGLHRAADNGQQTWPTQASATMRYFEVQRRTQSTTPPTPHRSEQPAISSAAAATV